MADVREQLIDLDGIPVLWVEPATSPRGAAVWLTHLGGSARQTVPALTRLAEAGFLAASFDPPGHGERARRPATEFAPYVLAAFRRRMWPLLGRTTLECLRVFDWIGATFAPPPLRVAGGVSMGGDIAVAVAGIETSISRVAALVSTPDWTRPGMRTLDDKHELIDQGEADAYAQWFFDQFDPMTGVRRYDRDVAMSFHCGADDDHVPPDGAQRFRDMLCGMDPAAGARITVDLHPGETHLTAARSPVLTGRAVAFLTTHDAPDATAA